MQKLFWLREYGQRMVLPQSFGKPVTFLRNGSLAECHEGNTTGVWLKEPAGDKREKDTQHKLFYDK